MKLRREKAVASGDEDVDAMYHQYSVSRSKKVLTILILIVVLIVAALYGLTVGSFNISFTDVYSIVFDHLINWDWDMKTVSERVVWDQRMPRLLTGILVGAGLSAAGAAMQSMMKNPLADPYTTGISSGASFGATIAIAFGIVIGSLNAGTTVLAFVCALVPAGVIIVLSTFKKTTPSMMILAGISVMYIFNALTQYLMLVVDEQTMAAAYEWTIGTLSKASWDNLPIMFGIVLAGSIAIMCMTKYLNAMNSGDNYAKTVGVDVKTIRIVILVIISIIAAGIVSFTGIIGFIGLVGPHITRIFLGSDNKILIPGSMLVGAIAIVVCDIFAKLFTNVTLPIGIVTAFIGGPMFLFLIIRQKKEVW
ncbi:MAG: iron ABC transporter permease [Candidatus Methanomethylophilaceae archaeon]|jgi:iron complex transport system permease protein|nr:iron ABC transporter permease [Candidatus Methanomethylophilaceae archaeon]